MHYSALFVLTCHLLTDMVWVIEGKIIENDLKGNRNGKITVNVNWFWFGLAQVTVSKDLSYQESTVVTKVVLYNNLQILTNSLVFNQ